MSMWHYNVCCETLENVTWERCSVHIPRHQQNKRILSCVSQYCDVFSTALYRYFAKHCCWHRNFKLSPCDFHRESSSFRSMKSIPLDCLALSSFSFSIAQLCFAFISTASDMMFDISCRCWRGHSPNHEWCHRNSCFNENTIENSKLIRPKCNAKTKSRPIRSMSVHELRWLLYDWADSVCGWTK